MSYTLLCDCYCWWSSTLFIDDGKCYVFHSDSYWLYIWIVDLMKFGSVIDERGILLYWKWYSVL